MQGIGVQGVGVQGVGVQGIGIILVAKPAHFGRNTRSLWSQNPFALGATPVHFGRKTRSLWSHNPFTLVAKFGTKKGFGTKLVKPCSPNTKRRRALRETPGE